MINVMYIYTSPNHITHKGPNQSFGNHMLHLYAVHHVSKKLQIPFKVCTHSNLDDLLELDSFKDFFDAPILFHEDYGGNVDDYYFKELQNQKFLKELLEGNIFINDNFQIKGWFWNADLLPDDSFFDEIPIRTSNLEKIKNKSYIQEEGTLVIHYRGTDFINHAIGWGDLRLRYEYYEKCIELYTTRNSLKKIVIVSDEPSVLLNEINIDVPVIVENNDYILDWLILLFSKNLVCSNSSFCYTAGWYKKDTVFQPEKFFTRYLDTDKTFPVNVYYKNSIIL